MDASVTTAYLILLSLGAVLSQEGTYIGSFKNYVHEIKGDIYALDEYRLKIEGFHYDGQGPDAFFWGGTSNKPDDSGIIIPNELNSKIKLGQYTGRTITITLPEALKLGKIKWLSVWCREFSVNFGDFYFPDNIELPSDSIPAASPTAKPAAQSIGKLRTLAHGVSGEVVAFDDQTIVINKFKYNGLGPAAYFWADYGDRLTNGGQILGSSLTTNVGDPLPRADGSQMVIVKIPDGRTINDYSVFGVWCEEAAVSFGEVKFPASGINVPSAKESSGTKKKSKLNCEVLDDDSAFEVRWALTNDNIVMQLVGKIEDGNYMSFGLSGNEERSDMVGGDVVVAWIDNKGEGHAEDYFLKSKESCSRNRGACPDTEFGKSNNIDMLNSAVVNGFHMVTVKRPLFKQDEEGDGHIYVDGPQAVIWAIGRMNSENLVTYHYKKRSKDTIMVDFARTPSWNCPDPDEGGSSSTQQRVTPKPQIPEPKEDLIPWTIPKFTCPRRNRFRARIGPSGGKKGYEAITGEAGWGIAWYINGILIPELTLQRGKTYRFDIEGGNDPENGAKTHPFYITNSRVGGYENADEEQRRNEVIYAGATYNDESKKYEWTKAGRLCEFTSAGNKRAEDYETFSEYKKDLRVKCQRGSSTKLTWRPTADTPDTVYYQCFTHKRLGWKINIVDSCDDNRGSASILSIKNVTKEQDLSVKSQVPSHGYNNKPHSLPHPKPSEVYNSKPQPLPEVKHKPVDNQPKELPRPIVRPRPTEASSGKRGEPSPIVVEEVIKNPKPEAKPPKRTIYVPVKIVPEHELPQNIPIHDGSDKAFVFGNPIAVPLGSNPSKKRKTTSTTKRPTSYNFSYESGFRPLILKDHSSITQPIAGSRFKNRPGNYQGSESIPETSFKPPKPDTSGFKVIHPVQEEHHQNVVVKGKIAFKNKTLSSRPPQSINRPQTFVNFDSKKTSPVQNRPHSFTVGSSVQVNKRPLTNPSQSGSQFQNVNKPVKHLPPKQPTPQYQNKPIPQHQNNQPRPQFQNTQQRPPFHENQNRPQVHENPNRPQLHENQNRPQHHEGHQRPPFEGQPRPHFEEGQPRPHFEEGQPRPHFEEGQQRPHFEEGQPRPHFQVNQQRPSNDGHFNVHNEQRRPQPHHQGQARPHQDRPFPQDHRRPQGQRPLQPQANYEETFKPIHRNPVQPPHFQNQQKLHFRQKIKQSYAPQKHSPNRPINHRPAEEPFRPQQSQSVQRPIISQNYRPQSQIVPRHPQDQPRAQNQPLVIHGNRKNSSEYEVLSHVMEYISQGQRNPNFSHRLSKREDAAAAEPEPKSEPEPKNDGKTSNENSKTEANKENDAISVSISIFTFIALVIAVVVV